MSRKNGKLSPRMEAGLISLLQFPTVTQAAKHSGIGESTLYRWLREDSEFQAEYRKRRRLAFSAATALLNKAASLAVAELVRMIQSPSVGDTARVSACRAILQYSESSLESEVTSYDAAELAAELERLKANE